MTTKIIKDILDFYHPDDYKGAIRFNGESLVMSGSS
jgi:hypothetical protein